MTQTECDSVCTLRERLKSWGVWVAVLGLLGLVLESVGVFAKIGLDSTEWELIITGIGTVLTAFGIVNNPTDRKHF